ncbi:MAG: HU family DNA-binding protein [Puniceicoccales bacterium]|jgi:nucleoid DNA-binding protein|nr:HU family DNA-binding protein [Puniceicoccales bacterium]
MMGKHLTKRELSGCLAKELGIDPKRAREGLKVVLNSILEALVGGRNVELRNFGVFEVQVRRRRVGRNPNYPKKDIIIPDRAVVKFKSGKKLKQRLSTLDLKSLARSKR